MKRSNIIINVILILVINIFYNYYSSASPTSEILCNGWLSATTGININNANPNPSPSHGGHNGDGNRFHISDNIGVKGVCKDYFPTYGEREMFYRTSDDPLTMELILKRQYCWARYVFIPQPDNCGGPDWKWAFPLGYLSWSKGVNYALWGDTITKTFSLQKMGPENSQTVFWGSNHAYIAYEQTSNKKDNPKRVCAWFKPVAFGKIVSSDDKLIGCIDIPLNPAPNIYNKIIVPKKSVIVANATPSDSTFIKPKINLQIVNSAGQPEGGYISLTYNFENSSSNCETVNNNSYCAFVPSGDPTKICAGLENTISSNIGCINRPRLTDSGIKLNAIHNYFIDNNCLDHSGKPSMFHSLKIQLLSNNKVIKEFPNQNAGLRDYYACTMTGSYKDKDSNKQIIQESTITGQDTIDIYGTQFRSVIPKLINSSNLDISSIKPKDIVKIRPENFQKTFIYPPIITGSSAGSSGGSSCNKCFVSVNENNCVDNELTSKARGQSKCSSYITPAGKRNRKSCNKNYSCYNFEDNPPPIKNVTDNAINCYFGAGSDKDPTIAYNDAEKAYCSGIYTINQQDEEKNTKSQTNVICMNLDTDWPNFYGKDDKICTEIPEAYMQLGINDISALTNYIDFTKDTFKKNKTYTGKEQLLGECNSSLGLENEKCLSTDGKTCTKLPTVSDYKNNIALKYQFTDFKEDYNNMQNYLYGDTDNKGINSNTLPADEDLLINLGYSSDLLKKDFSIIRDRSKDPYRELNGNFPIGTLHNSCRFIIGEDGCGKNDITAPFLGNANFNTSNLNIKIGNTFQILKTNPIDISTKLVANDVPVTGTCAKGFKPVDNNPPQRICRIIVNTDNNKIVTKSWSNAKIINPCISDNQSNG